MKKVLVYRMTLEVDPTASDAPTTTDIVAALAHLGKPEVISWYARKVPE